MTDKQLKAIYAYMGKPHDGYFLDSNFAWECVQEMEKKEDSDEFDIFLQDSNLADQQYTWLMNPDNFFNCFSKFLEVKHES